MDREIGTQKGENRIFCRFFEIFRALRARKEKKSFFFFLKKEKKLASDFFGCHLIHSRLLGAGAPGAPFFLTITVLNADCRVETAAI